MKGTSGRLLELLGLLQARVEWTAPELAARLGVTDRTVRNDVTRLRELGYPVDGVRGRAGHYRLGAGAKLPPLLLDDEEAVAVAVGLRTLTGVSGFEESGSRALTKLEHVLPDRLRRRVTALRDATEAGPVNTDSNVEDPEVDAGVLAEIADAIRDHRGLRAFFGDGADDERERIEIEPYRLVAWQRRWFVVGRSPATGEWAPYRVDWLTLRLPGGRGFTPAPLPGDLTELVVREVARTGWSVHARLVIDAPAEEVLSRINPAVGVVESRPDGRSVLVTGGDSLEIVAVWIGMLGLDFTVESPAALVDRLRVLAQRYAGAVVGSAG
ncbi:MULTISPECIES: helix-turn-helix transcriptional regulator [unclassified Nocardioides]|uniref:helix-turn-helix transcriptional regulator n=1 Tax=unclassified Nocardioides TaxID=2615069 RepID=UPI000702B803|nr:MULTISPECIES: WYL domain-containing protein [unclassified Nocardioides]KRC46307.1 DNA-binding transcriptional regulator [Nocardioides sp. Root79]KRC69654.1 DNA-binding transcriptional regulator [Nocardioides sp. Root240]